MCRAPVEPRRGVGPARPAATMADALTGIPRRRRSHCVGRSPTASSPTHQEPVGPQEQGQHDIADHSTDWPRHRRQVVGCHCAATPGTRSHTANATTDTSKSTVHTLGGGDAHGEPSVSDGGAWLAQAGCAVAGSFRGSTRREPGSADMISTPSSAQPAGFLVASARPGVVPVAVRAAAGSVLPVDDVGVSPPTWQTPPAPTSAA